LDVCHALCPVEKPRESPAFPGLTLGSLTLHGTPLRYHRAWHGQRRSQRLHPDPSPSIVLVLAPEISAMAPYPGSVNSHPPGDKPETSTRKLDRIGIAVYHRYVTTLG
jgi:hypothetical protein